MGLFWSTELGDLLELEFYSHTQSTSTQHLHFSNPPFIKKLTFPPSLSPNPLSASRGSPSLAQKKKLPEKSLPLPSNPSFTPFLTKLKASAETIIRKPEISQPAQSLSLSLSQRGAQKKNPPPAKFFFQIVQQSWFN